MNEVKTKIIRKIQIFSLRLGIGVLAVGLGLPYSYVHASAASDESKISQTKAFPIKYMDEKPDDLLALSKAHPASQIAAYTEQMNADAEERLAEVRKQYKSYSVEELIGQAERQVAIPVLEAALKIKAIVTEKDTVLYLGRSPSVLCLAAEFLEQAATSVHVNYSGTPNIKNLRKFEKNDLRNVVTSDRLNHFCSYLDQKGLQKLTSENHLYIVDILGTGANMNSFLRILRHYFLQHKKLTETPLVTLLLMNFTKDEKHLEKGRYYFDGASQTLKISCEALRYTRCH